MGDGTVGPTRGCSSVVPRAGVGALQAPRAATATAAGIDTRAALGAALDRYAATRVGTIGLVLRDNRDGGHFGWQPRTLQSYSTIKVLILVATLKRAQDRHLALTSTQKSLASRMIRYSDNAATDTLLAQIGVSTCQRVADQLGMSSTVVRGGSTGWWGHSTTTPRDLVQLMNQLVLGTYLTSGRRAYVRDLMATVTSTQRWGLGDPLPDAVHVEQKNGWGPMSSGYRMNSFGVRLRLRPQLPAGDPVQEPQRLLLRQGDDQPRVTDRLRRARPRPTDRTDRPINAGGGMTQWTPGRRELVTGGAAGLALGALGLAAAPRRPSGSTPGPSSPRRSTPTWRRGRGRRPRGARQP